MLPIVSLAMASTMLRVRYLALLGMTRPRYLAFDIEKGAALALVPRS